MSAGAETMRPETDAGGETYLKGASPLPYSVPVVLAAKPGEGPWRMKNF
jgi:hypothetical protein